MTLDDLDLFPEPDDRAPRKCWRHQWEYSVVFAQAVTGEPGFICISCGKVRDESAVRRGRNNASRGKAIQRKRIEGLGGTNLAGNNQNLDGIGLAFAYESKSGGAFSDRYWRWLTGIPVRGDQTRVLIVTETPGQGRRARSYVVVEYDDWKSLHGEVK